MIESILRTQVSIYSPLHGTRQSSYHRAAACCGSEIYCILCNLSPPMHSFFLADFSLNRRVAGLLSSQVGADGQMLDGMGIGHGMILHRLVDVDVCVCG